MTSISFISGPTYSRWTHLSLFKVIIFIIEVVASLPRLLELVLLEKLFGHLELFQDLLLC